MSYTILFNNITNQRITRVILGMSFSFDVTAWDDGKNDFGDNVDPYDNKPIKYTDLDGFGVIYFRDLPEINKLVKVQSLINAGCIGLEIDDEDDLSSPITTSQLIKKSTNAQPR